MHGHLLPSCGPSVSTEPHFSRGGRQWRQKILLQLMHVQKKHEDIFVCACFCFFYIQGVGGGGGGNNNKRGSSWFAEQLQLLPCCCACSIITRFEQLNECPTPAAKIWTRILARLNVSICKQADGLLPVESSILSVSVSVSLSLCVSVDRKS